MWRHSVGYQSTSFPLTSNKLVMEIASYLSCLFSYDIVVISEPSVIGMAWCQGHSIFHICGSRQKGQCAFQDWSFWNVKSEMKVSQSCPTLWEPVDCSPPGSSVHGILQAILEWVAIPFSRGSSWPRDWTWVSWIASRFFTIWATKELNVEQTNQLGESGSNSHSNSVIMIIIITIIKITHYISKA